jgi:hypothetical protein
MNPLFRALVSYALDAMPSLATADFVNFIQKLLEGSKQAYSAEEWEAEEPDWFDELLAYQRKEVGDEKFEELLGDYREMLAANSIDALVPIAIHLRTEIQLEQAPKPVYRLKDVHVVYHMSWDDGMTAEYNCRPFSPENLDLTVPVLSKLSQVFADQFGEALIRPGLDAFHDQVATPFDMPKFEELVATMLEYINSMPADRREPYKQIWRRITNAFHVGFSQETTSPVAMDVVRKGTTDVALEWGNDPQDGGFHR